MNKKAFHCLFYREFLEINFQCGFWFLDCSSWDRKEILEYYNLDKKYYSLANTRIVSIPDDNEETIKKARLYLSTKNTKTFVDLTKGEI